MKAWALGRGFCAGIGASPVALPVGRRLCWGMWGVCGLTFLLWQRPPAKDGSKRGLARPDLGRAALSAMAMLRSLLLLVCCSLSHAWQGAGFATRQTQRSACSAISMKHNEYFTRLQRAEAGRLRLCVFRCVQSGTRRPGHARAVSGLGVPAIACHLPRWA